MSPEQQRAAVCSAQGMKVRGGGRFPNLDRWFNALEQRPAYLGTRSDYFTHVHDLPPQIGGGRTTSSHLSQLHLLCNSTQ